jgi:hypothetical protein
MHVWKERILWRKIVVGMNDGLVLWICDDEGSEEWRLAVCQVSLIRIDGVGTGIVGGSGDVKLDMHRVGWPMLCGKAGVGGCEDDGS